MTLAEQIAQKSKVNFLPADASGIEKLRSLGLRENELAFYRNSSPTHYVELGDVRLCPIPAILVENKDYVPGCYTQMHGYTVFATTIYGDAFCFDTRGATDSTSSPIVLIAHDLAEEKYEMKREDFTKLVKPIASSLDKFLEIFLSEKLDIKPIYPPLDFLTTGEATI